MTTAEPRYFFIIGAMKAGTTSLYNYLADHPQLYASPKKEPRVFRDPKDAASLRTAFAALFEGRNGEEWCFEGSTAYTKYPRVAGVPARLQSIVPDARFIYLVRNPVDRTWSHYVHNLAHGRETRPFAEAIAGDPEYLAVSRYYMQLQQFLEVFPPDRILLQVFEELTKDPNATVRTVCEFLGVDSSYVPPTREVAYNASDDKRTAVAPLRIMRKMGVDGMLPRPVRYWLKERGTPLPNKRATFTPELRAGVAAALKDDVEAFFGVLGRRVPAWSDFK